MAGGFLQHSGRLVCQTCRGSDGGCMYVAGKFGQKQDGSAIFNACKPSQHGGALSNVKGVVLHGSVAFQNCNSGSESMTVDLATGEGTHCPQQGLPNLLLYLPRAIRLCSDNRAWSEQSQSAFLVATGRPNGRWLHSYN